MSKFMDMALEGIIAIALLPVLVSFIADANVTGFLGTLLDLVPIFYVIAVVAVFVYQAKLKK